MTQEEKAKAYDGNYKTYTELINRLEDVKNAIKKQNYGIAMDILCKPYPDYQITTSTELKESEDKMIKKALINGFNKLDKSTVWYNGITNGQILAYLEKQGEQKPADKVKPKFKVGDWVIDKQDIVHQIANVIENVTNHTYGYDIVGGGYFNDNTEGVRLWTIQDAKDGDVLANDRVILLFRSIGNRNWKDAISYYAILETNLNNRFSISDDEEYWGKVEDCELKSASEEQRDLLFQKMKEAGYEWDADKKELKKIEQNPQSTWKPSDEQMKALKEACDEHWEPDGFDPLYTLYQDLKKLREE